MNSLEHFGSLWPDAVFRIAMISTSLVCLCRVFCEVQTGRYANHVLDETYVILIQERVRYIYCATTKSTLAL